VWTHDGAYVAEVAGYLLTGYEHIRAEGGGHNYIVATRSTVLSYNCPR
jgi:hypothetical protein